MNNELYCYEKFNGYKIFVTHGDDFFYSEIFNNGHNIKWDIEADTGEECLDKCIHWCWEQEED